MSTKAVIGWLVVAIVLGIGVIVAFRGGGSGAGGPGVAVGDRVFAFSPSGVRRFSVGPQGAKPDVLDRTDSPGGEWSLRLGQDGPAVAWPVPAAQADSLLGVMADARAAASPPTGKGGDLGDTPTVVVFERTDGPPLTVRFAERTLGGAGLVEIETPAAGGKPASTVRAVINDSLHRTFRDRGVRAWRETSAMPWARGEVSRIRLENERNVLALARNEGRWSLREPVSAPADSSAVRRLLNTLAEARIAEFIDDGAPGVSTGLEEPKARVVIEIDRRSGETASGRPAIETITHTLEIGDAADLGKERLFAAIDEERLVKLDARSLNLSLAATDYLSPHPTSVSAADVGMVILERLDAQGAPSEDGRILKRSVDRWVELRDDGETPLVEQDLRDADEVVAFLTGTTPAAGAPQPPRAKMSFTPPEAYRAGARVSLRSLDGQPLATVEVGLSSVSAIAAVRTDGVYREYPLTALPRMIDRVMRTSPALNPARPEGDDAEPDVNK